MHRFDKFTGSFMVVLIRWISQYSKIKTSNTKLAYSISIDPFEQKDSAWSFHLSIAYEGLFSFCRIDN